MRSRCVRLVLGGAFLAAALVVPSTPPAAAEAAACGLVGVRSVSVGLSPTVAEFDVPAVHCAGSARYQDAWQVRMPPLGVDVTNDFPSAAFDPGHLDNSDTAPVSVDVRFFGPENRAPLAQLIAPAAFHLERRTTWGDSFRTTRVDSSHVRVSGTLRRANWDRGVYEPYGNRQVIR